MIIDTSGTPLGESLNLHQTTHPTNAAILSSSVSLRAARAAIRSTFPNAIFVDTVHTSPGFGGDKNDQVWDWLWSCQDHSVARPEDVDPGVEGNPINMTKANK